MWANCLRLLFNQRGIVLPGLTVSFRLRRQISEEPFRLQFQNRLFQRLPHELRWRDMPFFRLSPAAASIRAIDGLACAAVQRAILANLQTERRFYQVEHFSERVIPSSDGASTVPAKGRGPDLGTSKPTKKPAACRFLPLVPMSDSR